jgi:hypothetical protein
MWPRYDKNGAEMTEYEQQVAENTRKYGSPNPSPETIAEVDRQRDELATRRQAMKAARAATFERALRDRYMQTGASDADWERDRASVLAAARSAAAVSGDDAARRHSASRYG